MPLEPMASKTERVLHLDNKEPWVEKASEGTQQQFRAVFSVAGGVRLFPAGIVASSE